MTTLFECLNKKHVLTNNNANTNKNYYQYAVASTNSYNVYNTYPLEGFNMMFKLVFLSKQIRIVLKFHATMPTSYFNWRST